MAETNVSTDAVSKRYGKNGGIYDKVDKYLAELGKWPVWRAIIVGQVMSILLCVMATSSHFLYNKYNVAMPSGQTFPHYVLLCVMFTTWLACRSGERGILPVLRHRGWRYLLLAIAHLEANYLVLIAYQFTTLASVQLLDCVAIPIVLALSCVLLKVRYKIVHIVGVSLCLMGVGCLVWADIEDGRPIVGGKNRLLGDMLCIGGAAMFAAIMVTEEYVVKTLDWVEFLGMIGLFGSVLSGLQLWLLELPNPSAWDLDFVAMAWPLALFAGFAVAQFLFQCLAPVVLRDSGATAMQLSLLTADFYSLMVGIALLEYKFHALYFLSFALTMVGVLIYAIKKTPITSQQPANYRPVSRNHTTPPSVELANATVTPCSDMTSASPSQDTLLGSLDTSVTVAVPQKLHKMNGIP